MGGRVTASPFGRYSDPMDRLTRKEEAMLQRLHHVAYRCRDAAESVDFYTNEVSEVDGSAVIDGEKDSRRSHGDRCWRRDPRCCRWTRLSPCRWFAQFLTLRGYPESCC